MTIDDSKKIRTGSRDRRRKGRLCRTGGEQKVAAGFEIKKRQKRTNYNLFESRILTEAANVTLAPMGVLAYGQYLRTPPARRAIAAPANQRGSRWSITAIWLSAERAGDLKNIFAGKSVFPLCNFPMSR
jgi:hypothetical protein